MQFIWPPLEMQRLVCLCFFSTRAPSPFKPFSHVGYSGNMDSVILLKIQPLYVV